MLCLRYANTDDVAFIANTQRLPVIEDFIGVAGEEEIAAGIQNPDEAYLLALRDGDIPVGFAYLRQIKSRERSIEIYRLAIAERNKGYGSAFLKLIIEEAFESLNANRLWLDVFPENSRARKVYQRCGFIEEGILREVYFWNGEFRSAVIMSILASEYPALNTS